MAHQRRISTADVRKMHFLFVEFVQGFERLYYQRKTSRFTFVDNVST